MGREFVFLAAILVVIAAAVSAGCTSGDGPTVFIPESTVAPAGDGGTSGRLIQISDNLTASVLMDFVSEAAAYAEYHGTKDALAEFGDVDGIFSKDDLYVYAYGFNGTLLAHPYQPSLVGTDRSNWTDDRGFPFFKAANYTAENGGGFIAYLYPKPGDGSIDEAAAGSYIPKIGCVMPVDDEWWIGSGVYLSDMVDPATGNPPPATGEVVSLVNSGVQYALSNGDEAAFEAISDKNGSFVDPAGHYLYAYDFNGTLLAHPYLTADIGEDLIDHTGAFGEKDIQMLSDAAKDGGGYVVFSWPNPDNGNKPEIKIGYVLPVNDEWWLGSGAYLSEITGREEVLS